MGCTKSHGYYDKVSPKDFLTIQDLRIPRTVTFLYSHWYTHLGITSQIRDLSLDLTNARPIYSLCSRTSSKSIFLSFIFGNRVILTLTLTLIYREKSSIYGNRVVRTLTLTLTKKSIETDNYNLLVFSLSCRLWCLCWVGWTVPWIGIFLVG